MEVILLERVKSLGEMGAIVSVKPGYARNFLIPQKKALRANEASKQLFSERKATIMEESNKKLAAAHGIHAKLDKNFITIIRQAGEDGKLFGSVSPRDIANGISALYNQAIVHSEVILHNPIKYVNIHEVSLALHSDLHATIYVNIARSETEAEDAKKSFLTPPNSKKEKASSEEE